MSNHPSTRFLILSDTHSALPAESSDKQPFRLPLPSADVVIHCGDLTMVGKPEEHMSAIHLLKLINAELKIVIPGNHDLTLDTKYCQKHKRLYDWERNHTQEDLQSIRELYTNQAAKDAGIAYIEEGTRTFKLLNGNSFTVYASAYTPEFCGWAFPYPRSEDRFNSPTASNPIPDFCETRSSNDPPNIDIMVTHGPPRRILDTTFDKVPAGCQHLAMAVARCRPLLHAFGHIHEAKGALRKTWSTPDAPGTRIHVDAEKSSYEMGMYVDARDLQPGKETLFVNASVMSIRYKPTQPPWIVDLDLSRANS